MKIKKQFPKNFQLKREEKGMNLKFFFRGCSILSEFGTLQLEFDYLSVVTGNPIYHQKADTIREFLRKMEKPNGLYPNYLHPKTGKWGTRKIYFSN